MAIHFKHTEPTYDYCTMCGQFNDIRPYGENNALICFPCAMKNPERAAYNFLNTVAPDHQAEIKAAAKEFGQLMNANEG